MVLTTLSDERLSGVACHTVSLRSETRLAEELLESPPKIGYLTISNALQWRLQYRRVIDRAGSVDGVRRVG